MREKRKETKSPGLRTISVLNLFEGILGKKERSGMTAERKEVMTIEDGYSESKADYEGNENQRSALQTS